MTERTVNVSIDEYIVEEGVDVAMMEKVVTLAGMMLFWATGYARSLTRMISRAQIKIAGLTWKEGKERSKDEMET